LHFRTHGRVIGIQGLSTLEESPKVDAQAQTPAGGVEKHHQTVSRLYWIGKNGTFLLRARGEQKGRGHTVTPGLVFSSRSPSTAPCSLWEGACCPPFARRIGRKFEGRRGPENRSTTRTEIRQGGR